MMGKMWRRKWLLIGATLAVFLSIGTVAWAVSVDEVGTVPAGSVETAASLAPAAGGPALGSEACPDGCAELRKNLQEKREELRKLRVRLMEELREEMTEADKAVYDGLKATIEEQREILKGAREELKETMESLRELTKKYLDAGTETDG
ncbi:MAG: hypothetical protein JW990_11640 [Thermoleophilia bacterium]|nr:hypothetical protein [Thermoleophilia bacterium]